MYGVFENSNTLSFTCITFCYHILRCNENDQRAKQLNVVSETSLLFFRLTSRYMISTQERLEEKLIQTYMRLIVEVLIPAPDPLNSIITT